MTISSRIFFFLSLFLLSFALDLSTLESFRAWRQFKERHGKNYASLEEEHSRFQIFQNNFRYAQELDRKSARASFGVTQFSDLTPQEFKQIFLMNVSRSFNDAVSTSTISKVSALPNRFDWKDKGVVTPIKNQGQCGSCWDFSATETIESVCALAGYPLTSLSEQQILDCDKKDFGCNGGWPYNAYEYVISAGGLESASAYPYESRQGVCKFHPADVKCKVEKWEYVTKDKDEQTMQQFLYQNSPLSACVDASSWQFYTGGVLTPDNCGDNIDHCIQITGWSEVQGVPAWTIRNSWGTAWGNNGYIFLERGKNTCAIAEVVTVPCVKSKDGSKTVC